jgi:hypothetical protein
MAECKRRRFAGTATMPAVAADRPNDICHSYQFHHYFRAPIKSSDGIRVDFKDAPLPAKEINSMGLKGFIRCNEIHTALPAAENVRISIALAVSGNGRQFSVARNVFLRFCSTSKPSMYGIPARPIPRGIHTGCSGCFLGLFAVAQAVTTA